MLDQERFVEVIVTRFEDGSTVDVSRTWDIGEEPRTARTQAGAVWEQVIRRSVVRIPVCGSTERESVSTAMT